MSFESFPKPEEQQSKVEEGAEKEETKQGEMERDRTRQYFPELHGQTREYYAELYGLPKDSSYEEIKQKMDESTDKGFDRSSKDITQESDLVIRMTARELHLPPETPRQEVESAVKARLEIDRYEQKLKHKYLDDPYSGDRKIEATKLGLPEKSSWKDIWAAKDGVVKNKIQKYKELYPDGVVGDANWFKYLNQRVLEKAEKLRKQRLEKTK